MKNLILFLMVMFMAASCNKRANEQLKEKDRELTRLASERDSVIQELSSIVGEFESTLGIFDKRGELRERLQQSVEHLKDILDEKDRKEKSLQRMVAGSRMDRDKLRSEIDSLNRQIESKENQIAALNTDVYNLKTQADTQQMRINRLVSLNIDNNSRIENMVAKLNTGHFVVGKPKELLEKEVVVKRGGFLGLFGRVKKLNPSFNQDEFKRVDILSDTIIELPGEKINIVTVHPSGTYNVVDSLKQIEITDPEKFWQTSKFLVVENR